MKLFCTECGEQMFTWKGGAIQTLVGYLSPKGHDHDDNCRHKVYQCVNGHAKNVSKINKCPSCDWLGKKECWCHVDPKVEEWYEGEYDDFNTWVKNKKAHQRMKIGIVGSRRRNTEADKDLIRQALIKLQDQ